jgi:hypothetical protein
VDRTAAEWCLSAGKLTDEERERIQAELKASDGKSRVFTAPAPEPLPPHYTVHVPEGGFLAIIAKGHLDKFSTERLYQAYEGLRLGFKALVFSEGEWSFVGVGPEAKVQA